MPRGTYSYEDPTDVAAFVGAFGDAFANTHNQRIQMQLARKARQDAAIGETLIKSGMEDPELWQNDTFKKAAASALGKQQAAAMAEVAMQFAQSPMGLLKKALGTGVLAAPVSAEADGPGTGPSVPYQELNPMQQTQVARERLKTLTPAEAGLGFDNGLGQLVAQSQNGGAKPMTEYQRRSLELREKDLARREKLTPYQQEMLNRRDRDFDALERQRTSQREFQRSEVQRKQGNVDREFGLKEEGEGRRAGEANRRQTLGRIEPRTVTTPMGDTLEYQVRVVANNDGLLTETPVAKKLGEMPASAVDKFQGLNTALRITDDLSDLFEQSPDEIEKILIPFAGRKFDEIAAKIGALTPAQRKFVLRVNELRKQVSFASGGKALTGTELGIFDGILPNLSELATNLPIVLDHTRDMLTSMGVDTENALTQAGRKTGRTRVTARNRDFVQALRKPPLALPGPSTSEPSRLPQTAGDDDLNSAFMGQ